MPTKNRSKILGRDSVITRLVDIGRERREAMSSLAAVERPIRRRNDLCPTLTINQVPIADLKAAPSRARCRKLQNPLFLWKKQLLCTRMD
jgi:hypothetical protein